MYAANTCVCKGTHPYRPGYARQPALGSILCTGRAMACRVVPGPIPSWLRRTALCWGLRTVLGCSLAVTEKPYVCDASSFYAGVFGSGVVGYRVSVQPLMLAVAGLRPRGSHVCLPASMQARAPPQPRPQSGCTC